MVEGERVAIRYWIDARTHIFESQVLLIGFFFLHNQRKLKKNNTPDSPLCFCFFRAGVLLRNFAFGTNQTSKIPVFRLH